MSCGAQQSQLPRLIVLAPSHYCEKASWALQRYKIAYEVHIVAPGFHSSEVKAAGSQGTSTPVLVFPAAAATSSEPSSLCDSADIVAWVDKQRPVGSPTLFPADKANEIADLLERFDKGLGSNTRLFVYSHCLDTEEMLSGLCAGTPCLQQTAYFFGMKYIVRSVIRNAYRVNAENGAKALEDCREEFRRVAELLSDGRKYLTGDTFTAADLSFVSLAAPVLGINFGYAKLFENTPRPAGLQAAVDELTQTPAGKWALGVWEQDRLKVVV
jgi:glutathione S-transferase